MSYMTAQIIREQERKRVPSQFDFNTTQPDITPTKHNLMPLLQESRVQFESHPTKKVTRFPQKDTIIDVDNYIKEQSAELNARSLTQIVHDVYHEDHILSDDDYHLPIRPIFKKTA